MTSAISKSLAVGVALNLLLACGLEDPTPAEGGAGSLGNASGGSPAAGGGAGEAGSTAVAGSAVGGASGSGGAAAGANSGGASVGGTAVGGGAGSGGGGAGAGGGTAGMAGAGGTAGLPFALTSPMLQHVEACTPQNHQPCMVFLATNEMETMNGDNISPELNWGAGPAGTQSYAIVLHDFSNMYTHWVIWNIPAATLKLPANLAKESKPAVPAGSQQKSFENNNAGFGYMGPGADDHVYEFKLYALNVATFTPKTPGEQGKVREELEANAGNFVLAKSALRGRSKKY